jgi:hypothetical protein
MPRAVGEIEHDDRHAAGRQAKAPRWARPTKVDAVATNANDRWMTAIPGIECSDGLAVQASG